MKVLIASDIFGTTPELSTLAKRIHEEAWIVSPYAAQCIEFGSEAEAYASFQQSGGLDAYAEKLSTAIAALRPDALVAFSAGATAGWRALSHGPLSIRLGVLFYGSRIRDYLHVRPTVPVKLVFAEHEKAFQVAPLLGQLCERGVTAEVVPGTRHGFMNARSPGYDAAAMQAGIEQTIQLLSRLNAAPLPNT